MFSDFFITVPKTFTDLLNALMPLVWIHIIYFSGSAKESKKPVVVDSVEDRGVTHVPPFYVVHVSYILYSWRFLVNIMRLIFLRLLWKYPLELKNIYITAGFLRVTCDFFANIKAESTPVRDFTTIQVPIFLALFLLFIFKGQGAVCLFYQPRIFFGGHHRVRVKKGIGQSTKNLFSPRGIL